jgi:hypothetical protein
MNDYDLAQQLTPHLLSTLLSASGDTFNYDAIASGRTLRFIAEEHPDQVYGFDGFDGLPEDWRPGYAAGAFAQAPPETLPNAEIFDEFLNYPGWRAHEFKAWYEFMEQQHLNFHYAGCVPSHQQVSVILT